MTRQQRRLARLPSAPPLRRTPLHSARPIQLHLNHPHPLQLRDPPRPTQWVLRWSSVARMLIGSTSPPSFLPASLRVAKLTRVMSEKAFGTLQFLFRIGVISTGGFESEAPTVKIEAPREQRTQVVPVWPSLCAPSPSTTPPTHAVAGPLSRGSARAAASRTPRTAKFTRTVTSDNGMSHITPLFL